MAVEGDDFRETMRRALELNTNDPGPRLTCINCSLQFTANTERPFGICPGCSHMNPIPAGTEGVMRMAILKEIEKYRRPF